MKNTDTEIEALKKREAQLKARIAQLEAKKATQARKEDTRLKVVVGAAVLADVKLNPASADPLRKLLARAVTAPRDRDFLTAQGWLDAGPLDGKKP